MFLSKIGNIAQPKNVFKKINSSAKHHLFVKNIISQKWVKNLEILIYLIFCLTKALNFGLKL